MSDLIRREDAIEAIEELPNAYNGWSDAYDKAYIIGTLEEVPSADRPQGEWIVNMPNYESICSVCGAKETDFIYGTEMWYGLGESKFCPSCGARMKGADDE